MSESISVEVAYALPEKQRIVKLDVPPGTTALEAVTLSKLDEVFDELVIGPDLKLGVWGKATTTDRCTGGRRARGDLQAVTGRSQRGAQGACGQGQSGPS